MEDENKTTVEYIYKEYVRLIQVCDSYIKSSFDDLKVTATMGLFIAWVPLANVIKNTWEFERLGLVLLLGFIAIFLILMIILTQDLLKQSLINYNLEQIQHCEEVLRSKLNLTETKLFRLVENWQEWRESKYNLILSRLSIFFTLISLIFPTIALFIYNDPWWYALIYFGIGGILLSIHIGTAKTLGYQVLPFHRSK